ncbi:MAG: hypothetical protein L3J07_01830 [Candidatus Magasanikbacteria bacterium]|nr:hypothetical protein [Candidatus Magasanikbacteria bacterium]
MNKDNFINKKTKIISIVLASLIVLTGIFVYLQYNNDTSTSKIYIDNEYREKETQFNTYLESLSPIVVYSDKNTGEFIGLTSEGKEVILNIPKIDFFNVSSISFDKSSDTIYYINSKYDSVKKTQVGVINKIDLKDKTDSKLIDSIVGGIQYVDNDVLAINEYGVDGEAVIQLYNANDGTLLSPKSYVKSNKYQTEYRIVTGNEVYQMVFDNYGVMKNNTVMRPDGIHQISFPVSSDSIKIYFNKIGTLNRTYILDQNISASDYLRSVYDDQQNTSSYFLKTTGDIWPKGNTEPKLTLYPSNPVKKGDYYDTYYTMGNLYNIDTEKYVQMIGDSLVTFDISDMSVKITTDKNDIDNLLRNKKFVAPIANYIEEAGTPAACGDSIGSSFEYPRVLENRQKTWFAYCLR